MCERVNIKSVERAKTLNEDDYSQLKFKRETPVLKLRNSLLSLQNEASKSHGRAAFAFKHLSHMHLFVR